MKKEKQAKTMRDANGNDIPLKYVSAYDRAARRILARFQRERKALEALVAGTVAELQALAGAKERVGEKGNFQATSFDGLIKVAVRQQYNIMLEYVNGVLDRVSGVDVSALRLLVEAAFKANAQGYLSTGKVLSLLRMEVDSDKWREAKRILQDALKPVRGKRYLACESRPSTQADFRPIRLDIADCWPEESGAQNVV